VGALRGVLAQWTVLLLVLLGLLAAIDRGELLWRLDHALYDAALRGGPAPRDIVIVAIDDASLAAIGRWPWPRATHARLLERLRAAGVRGVALDVIFTEAEPGGGDAQLARALAAGPPTVLPLLAVSQAGGGGGLVEQAPVEPLASAAAALGHAHVEIDRDGLARSVYLREGRGAPTHAHFALALLERVAPGELAPPRGERHPDLGGAPRDAWVRDLRVMIPFLGPPGHFTTLSYADVLEGAVDPSRLRGRWVLVGATAQGLGDAYATPLARTGRTTAGVELGANVLQALRDGRGIVPLAPGARLALGALPLLAAFAGFLWLSPRRSLVLLVLLWVATAGASALALHVAQVWWPPAAALALLTLAYPLWNWRRLEATQQFLEREFARLMAERTPLAREPALPSAATGGGDLLQRRIDLVDAATTRVRDLRRLLTDTIAHLPDAVLVVDLDGRIALASPAAATLLGRDPLAAASLVDAPVAALLHAAFGADAEGAAGPAAPTQAELRTLARDGVRPRDLLLRTAPVLDEDGRRRGTLVSLVDVTLLRDAQRERDDLARFLSHDLRSPVTSLLALADMQRDPARALAPPQFAARVGTLAQRSLDLADGFLALARAEALDRGRFETLDLRDAVQDAVDEAWATAQHAQVSLNVEAPRVAEVLGDRSLLARALVNLLRNAIRFTPPGGAVLVGLECSGAHHEVRVVDAGPGVDPGLRERLFERFQRGPSGDAAAYTARGAQPSGHGHGFGHGLGLALVRAVATRHGGQAGVRERQDGRSGSEFYLRLPAAPAAGHA
jgi:CHASE2 domain-containing sensor protein/signal transduction histidine kinase